MIQFLCCADRTSRLSLKIVVNHYPADIAQNSYMPGHMGQSSPQLSVRISYLTPHNKGIHTSVHLRLISILNIRGNVLEESNVFVGMKPRHILPTSGFGDLRKLVSKVL